MLLFAMHGGLDTSNAPGTEALLDMLGEEALGSEGFWACNFQITKRRPSKCAKQHLFWYMPVWTPARHPKSAQAVSRCAVQKCCTFELAM